jgi:hypothetical protein
MKITFLLFLLFGVLGNSFAQSDVILPGGVKNGNGATNGQVLKWNGTTWQPEADLGPTGSGLNTRVAYWNGGNSLTSNANFTTSGSGITLSPGLGNNAIFTNGLYSHQSTGVISANTYLNRAEYSGTSSTSNTNINGYNSNITLGSTGTPSSLFAYGMRSDVTIPIETVNINTAGFQSTTTNNSGTALGVRGMFGAINNYATTGDIRYINGLQFDVNRYNDTRDAHVARGINARVLDNSTGRWDQGYGADLEVAQSKTAYGVNVGIINSRLTENTQTGYRAYMVTSGAGTTTSNLYGLLLEGATNSGGSVINQYGILDNFNLSSVTGNKYFLYSDIPTNNNYISGNIGVGGTPITGTKISVRGGGNTTATYSFRVRNAFGLLALSIRDDRTIVFDNLTGSGNRIMELDPTGIAARSALDPATIVTNSTGTITLDDAYNNFGANAATIVVDNAQGQGNLSINLPSTQDFIIQDNGTAFATFDDSGNIGFGQSPNVNQKLIVSKTASATQIPLRLNNGIDEDASGTQLSVALASTDRFAIRSTDPAGSYLNQTDLLFNNGSALEQGISFFGDYKGLKLENAIYKEINNQTATTVTADGRSSVMYISSAATTTNITLPEIVTGAIGVNQVGIGYELLITINRSSAVVISRAGTSDLMLINNINNSGVLSPSFAAAGNIGFCRRFTAVGSDVWAVE